MANPNARRSGGGCFSLAIRVGIVAFIIYVGIGFLNGEVKMPRASSPQEAAPFVLDDLPTPAPKQYTTLYIDEGVTFEVHGPSCQVPDKLDRMSFSKRKRSHFEN